MLEVCWSPKGGSGTSVVAAALAVQAAAAGRSTRLIDLEGDQPAIFGVQAEDGIGDWFAADDDVGPDTVRALEIDLAPGLRLVGRGRAASDDWAAERMALALTLFHNGPDLVVIDAGRNPPVGCPAGVGESVVIRACYLGLRQLMGRRRSTAKLVVIEEPGRSLARRDIVAAVGEVDAVLPWDPAVARAVDAGLLAGRMPRSLRPLGRLLEPVHGRRT